MRKIFLSVVTLLSSALFADTTVTCKLSLTQEHIGIGGPTIYLNTDISVTASDTTFLGCPLVILPGSIITQPAVTDVVKVKLANFYSNQFKKTLLVEQQIANLCLYPDQNFSEDGINYSWNIGCNGV